MAARELVGDHPPHVVPVALVLATRVAEAGHEEIQRRGALAPTKEAHELLLGRRIAGRGFP
jgi:hypothetical protein